MISSAASRARASQLAQTLDHMTGEVAAALPRDQFDQSMVRTCIRETFVSERGLTEEIANALLDQVTARVQSHILRRASASPRRSSASASTSSSSSSDSDHPDAVVDQPADRPTGSLDELSGRVSNHRRSKEHLIVDGPPSLNVGMWVTRCGWRFGRSNEARQPEQGDALCTRCFRHRVG